MSALYPVAVGKRDISQAALTLVSTEGVPSVTMARLAELTGLSRPAVYQYFPSREHVLGELMLNDIADLANNLERLVGPLSDPYEQVRVWVHYCLAYLASEEHQLIQHIGRERLPAEQLGEIGVLHGMFMTSLLRPLQALGARSPESLVHLIYGAVSAAATRVINGSDLTVEAHSLESFALAGLESALDGSLADEAVENESNHGDNRHHEDR
jgi:AcrR family transcriptional regulator